MPRRRPVPILTSKLLRRFPELVHGIGRVAGGFRFGDQDYTRDSRQQFFRRLGIQPKDVVMAEQVHGRWVRRVSVGDRRAGFRPDTRLARTDGLVTTDRGIMLAVFAADCVPVMAVDLQQRVVGVAHAGWRGILAGIIPSFVRELQRAGASSRSLFLWLGPAAHACCYALRPADAPRTQDFIRRFGHTSVRVEGKTTYLDLPQAIVTDLIKAGVPRRQIDIDPACTIHDSRAWPSHRRQGKKRQHSLMGMIGLRDPLDHVKGKHVLVIGLGLHGGGVASIRWLVRHGARVTVTDKKNRSGLATSLRQLSELPVTYILGRHRSSDVRQADLVIANPGVPRESPLIQTALRLRIPVESDAAIFFRHCRSPIIGVTGTKGKTTTTVLIEAMLRANHRPVVSVGHNQVPLLHVLDRLSARQLVVAELSSWRLEGLAARGMSPHIAVITNIMPDHLNRYRNFAAYVRAKQTIVNWQRHNDNAVLNRDNPVTRTIGQRVVARRWWFSRRYFRGENGAFIRHDQAYIREDGQEHQLFRLADVRRPAGHEISNLLAAAVVARICGVKLQAIRRIVRTFQGIPHRLETLGAVDGVRYINDSSATTPEAALAGLESVTGNLILIAGGTDKRLDYRAFGQTISARCKSVILFDGSATRKLLRHVINVPVTVVRDMHQAVRLANLLADRGDTVLLSPGAASFGVFQHEFDRGDQFRQAVTELRQA